MKKLFLCFTLCFTCVQAMQESSRVLATGMKRLEAICLMPIHIPPTGLTFKFFSPEDEDAQLQAWRRRLAQKILAELKPRKREK